MSDRKEVSIGKAYIYTTGLACASIANTIFGRNYTFSLFHLAMKVRVATCSLIYRKSLRLSSQALCATTVGHLVNLLSNDVNRFDGAIIHMQTLLLFPLWICVLLYVIYSYIGLVACIGIVSFAVYIPLQCEYNNELCTSNCNVLS